MTIPALCFLLFLVLGHGWGPTLLETEEEWEFLRDIVNRLRGHESHIRNYHKHPGNPVAQHFGINLNNAQDYKIQILDQECDKNRRLRLEEAWIFILKTPGGLNTKWKDLTENYINQSTTKKKIAKSAKFTSALKNLPNY